MVLVNHSSNHAVQGPMEALGRGVGGSLVCRRAELIDIQKSADLTHQISVELLRTVSHDKQRRSKTANHLLHNNSGHRRRLLVKATEMFPPTS